MFVNLGNVAVLRTFRVLRALKTVAVVPGIQFSILKFGFYLIISRFNHHCQCFNTIFYCSKRCGCFIKFYSFDICFSWITTLYGCSSTKMCTKL